MAQYFSQPFPEPGSNVYTLPCTVDRIWPLIEILRGDKTKLLPTTRHRVVQLNSTLEIEVFYMLFDRSLYIYDISLTAYGILQFQGLNPVEPPCSLLGRMTGIANFRAHHQRALLRCGVGAFPRLALLLDLGMEEEKQFGFM